jgi:hypothetical protein
MCDREGRHRGDRLGMEGENQEFCLQCAKLLGQYLGYRRLNIQIWSTEVRLELET